MKIFRCGILALSLFTLAALPGCSPLDANGETVPNDGGESPADPTIFKSTADSPQVSAKVNEDWGTEALNINATVRLPQLDEMPMYGQQLAANQQSRPRQKVAGPKPVVRVYHLSGSCPAFNRFQTWHYNLTQQQREDFPVAFAAATVDDSLPCPTFHFQTPDERWWYIHGWNGPDDFLRRYYGVADQLNDRVAASPSAPLSPAPRSCTCGPDCQCCPGCPCGGTHGPVSGQAASQSAPMSASCSSGSCGVSGVRMKGGKRR